MDWLLSLSLSHNLTDFGISAEKRIEDCYVGAEISALYLPELGAQTLVYIKSTDKIYFRLGGGISYFDKEIPDEIGTQFNFVASFRLGYEATRKITPYIEARHYSNGNQDLDDNPGYDRIIAGLSYKF